jgi:hypothetical protein
MVFLRLVVNSIPQERGGGFGWWCLFGPPTTSGYGTDGALIRVG